VVVRENTGGSYTSIGGVTHKVRAFARSLPLLSAHVMVW
jgi:isocitrate/isopropylmalate dehydrogenase